MVEPWKLGPFCSQVHPFLKGKFVAQTGKPRRKTKGYEKKNANWEQKDTQGRAIPTTGSPWWWLSRALLVSLHCFVFCSSLPMVFATVCPCWVILGLLSYLL